MLQNFPVRCHTDPPIPQEGETVVTKAILKMAWYEKNIFLYNKKHFCYTETKVN